MKHSKFLLHLQNSYLKIITGLILGLFLFLGYIVTLFYKTKNKHYIWKKLGKLCLTISFAFCFIKVKTQNKELLPKGPCVIAMNHRSLSDTLSLIATLDRYFFVITEPFDAIPHPFLQAWVSNLGYFPVIRDEKDKKAFKVGMDRKYVVEACIERVKKGETLVIYPEAHHESHKGLLKFKTGAVRIALGAGVPLVPGAFTQTDKVITPKKNKLHPGTIHIRFGNPLDIEKLWGKHKDKAAVRKITSQLKKEIDLLVHHWK